MFCLYAKCWGHEGEENVVRGSVASSYGLSSQTYIHVDSHEPYIHKSFQSIMVCLTEEVYKKYGLWGSNWQTKHSLLIEAMRKVGVVLGLDFEGSKGAVRQVKVKGICCRVGIGRTMLIPEVMRRLRLDLNGFICASQLFWNLF